MRTYGTSMVHYTTVPFTMLPMDLNTNNLSGKQSPRTFFDMLSHRPDHLPETKHHLLVAWASSYVGWNSH